MTKYIMCIYLYDSLVRHDYDLHDSTFYVVMTAMLTGICFCCCRVFKCEKI